MDDWERLFWKLGLDGCSAEELEKGVMFPEGLHDNTDEIFEEDIEAAMNGEDGVDSEGYVGSDLDMMPYHPERGRVMSTLGDLAEANRQRALDEDDEERLLMYESSTPGERRDILKANVPESLSLDGTRRFIRVYISTFGLGHSAERMVYLTTMRRVRPDGSGRRRKVDLVSMIDGCVGRLDDDPVCEKYPDDGPGFEY